MKDFDPQRNPLEELAEEFTARCRRGDAPSVEEYTQAYPELADQIETLFPSIAMMEQLGEAEESHRSVERQQAVFRGQHIPELNDFQIVGETGRGGMGVVFEAIQQSLRRRVAIKVLARQIGRESKHLRRFQREARMAANLHHTNIVPVFGIGEQRGNHYYVMQFIDGVGLDEVLAALTAGPDSTVDQPAGGRPSQVAQVIRSLQQGVFRQPSRSAASTFGGTGDTQASSDEQPDTDWPGMDRGSSTTLAAQTIVLEPPEDTVEELPESQPPVAAEMLPNWVSGSDYWQSIARIGWQVADALQYAHALGTLHRDIKPGNLLLEAQGQVWVADFGLAKAIENDEISQTGDVVGTLRYMAPEQFAGQADPRSDIYSLGLTLYEAITLKPAYGEASRLQFLRHHAQRVHFPAPRQLNPRIPVDLETIVLKACAEEPADRYQSAAELQEDLGRFLVDEPIQARRCTPWERLWRWCRRNPTVASLSSAVVFLLVLVAVSTTVSYIRTRSALEREHQQRELAQSAQDKAESTLQLSLLALDRIYRRFAPDRLLEEQLTLSDAAGEELSIPVQPVLSNETAAILAELLTLYDQLAQHDSDNIQLRAEAAKANRRVGDIQQRLGQFREAESAYLDAIGRYQNLPDNDTDWTLEIARIHNELGNVYRAELDLRQARQSHEAALELLDRQQRSLPAERFELARTCYFLARRPEPEGVRGPPPPGGGRRPHFPPRRGSRGGKRPPGPPPELGTPPHLSGPDHREMFGRAIDLLTSLQSEDPETAEYRYLLALCYRDRSRHPDSVDEQQAIDLLQQLAVEFPEIADYRYALSVTYARFKPPHPGSRQPPAQLDERLRQALEYAQELVAEHPQDLQYASTKSQIHFKLGMMYMHRARSPRRKNPELLAQAEQHLQSAYELQQQIMDRTSSAWTHVFTLARTSGHYSEVLLELNAVDDACRVLRQSIDRLESMLGENRQQLHLQGPLRENYRLLGIALRRAGETDGSRQENKE